MKMPTAEMTKTKMILLNNLAECLLRLGRYRDAEQRATEVLQIDERDLKAMWRRGRARVRLLEVRLTLELSGARRGKFFGAIIIL